MLLIDAEGSTYTGHGRQARYRGVAIVLRWLRWFNGVGRPWLAARMRVRSVRQSTGV
jgi:hypothetical protein